MIVAGPVSGKTWVVTEEMPLICYDNALSTGIVTKEQATILICSTRAFTRSDAEMTQLLIAFSVRQIVV